jgi:Putative 2OG-Fe(II) oxygenase
VIAADAVTSTAQIAASCRAEPLIFDGVCPDLCPALEEIILRRMTTHRRSTASLNSGGWKSSEDFFSWPDDAVQDLREVISVHVGALRLVAWAMVNRAGSHHPRHQHRIASLSGIYYVTAGSEDAITPTIYECEGDGSGRYELEVEPHPGRLVICRGECWHRVMTYPGDLPRITIAFDVRR